MSILSMLVIGTAVLFAPSGAAAQAVKITENLPHLDIRIGKKVYRIRRNQDTRARISGDFARTSLPCPPRCIQPLQPASGVRVAGELEVMEFLRTKGRDFSGILVDSRSPRMYRQGTIPGALNIPAVLMAENNPYQERILTVLGARKMPDGSWNFDNARELMLFCIGPTCSLSPRNIRTLVKIGYPPEKLHYYRNGVRGWVLMGLPLVKPGKEKR